MWQKRLTGSPGNNLLFNNELCVFNFILHVVKVFMCLLSKIVTTGNGQVNSGAIFSWAFLYNPEHDFIKKRTKIITLCLFIVTAVFIRRTHSNVIQTYRAIR